MFGSASADLMMSRAPSCSSSSTGRIPGCNRTPRLAIYGLEERLLDGGVHTRLLGGQVTGVPTSRRRQNKENNTRHQKRDLEVIEAKL
jgi:hypothetical protein